MRQQIRDVLEREYGFGPGAGGRAISPTAKIGAGVRLGRDVVIHEGVEIGDGAQVGDRVSLFNCKLGPGARVEDNCIVGYRTLTGGFSHKLDEMKLLQGTVIGAGTLVRTGCTIYQSV